MSVILGLVFAVVVPRTSRAVEIKVCVMKLYRSSICRFSHSSEASSFLLRESLRRSLYFFYESRAVLILERVFGGVMFSVMVSYVISGL